MRIIVYYEIFEKSSLKRSCKQLIKNSNRFISSLEGMIFIIRALEAYRRIFGKDVCARSRAIGLRLIEEVTTTLYARHFHIHSIFGD